MKLAGKLQLARHRPVASKLALGSLALCLLACGVADPSGNTGGTTVAAGPCGRGLVIVHTDYQSTNVALLSNTGQVLSPSFISSASSSTELSAPLSGDVVVPSSAANGASAVLVDRYPASILTWVSIETGAVLAQLDVGTGFAANPQDYLRVDEATAYVSRFATNPAPGTEPLDAGGDLLIVDPRVPPAITGRVDLSETVADAPGHQPRANRMVHDGSRLLFVLLAAYNGDFSSSAPSRLAVIDTETSNLISTKVLTGLHGCSALAIEPPYRQDTALDSRRLAVGCSGSFSGDSTSSLAESGLVLLTFGADGSLAEQARFEAAAMVGQPLGFSVDFDQQGHVLTTVLGHFGQMGQDDETDAVVALDPTTAAVEIVLRGNKLPFELGEVRCITPYAPPEGPSCEAACFVADAERSVLHRLVSDAAGYRLDASIEVEQSIGLPPRGVGRF